MNGFVDYHQHCLWGMDDGATTFEESCHLLQLSVEEGITTVAATPHVSPGQHPFDITIYRQRLGQLAHWAKENNLSLTLLEGAEVRYTDQALPMLREGRIPTIGGSAYVLIEFSPYVAWWELENAVGTLFRGGYIPILAHIERYRRLYSHVSDLLRLHRKVDVCFQANASALTAATEFLQRIFLKQLLDRGSIDLIATDAHDCEKRIPNMDAAFHWLQARYGQQYAYALTHFSVEDHLQKLCGR